jgi:phospholipid/cholesterol/gamma-HCH transport system substrate-binding protein
MRTAGAAIKLTIFVVITTLATAMLALTISDTSFTDKAEYRVRFTDVTGVVVGDEVRIAGVAVGNVEEIRIHWGTQRQAPLAEVVISVRRTLTLPSGTLAQVRYRNLVGQRYISLSEGAAAGDSLPKNGRGLIPVTQTQPALDLNALFNGFRPLFRALRPQEVNQLAGQIVQVLQGEGGTIHGLLAHVASLTNSVADRDVVIGRVITNLNEVLGALAARDRQVTQLVENLRALVSGLARDRNAIGSSLVSVNDLTGTMGELLRDVRPSVRADVAELGKLSKTIADDGAKFDGMFQRMPGKLTALSRVTSYGSWVNFYLCSFDARVSLPDGPEIATPRIENENARCEQ